MSGQRKYLSGKRVHNELNQLGGNLLYTFLDNVVSVLIFYTFHYISLQLFDQFALLIDFNHLKSLIYRYIYQ